MSEPAATARQDKAVLLSLLGVSTMVIAYALALGVLSDADMASKFENGVVPDHTDIASIRVSVIGSIVTAALSVTLATAGDIASNDQNLWMSLGGWRRKGRTFPRM
ncbi:hypothetical protein, partial [Mycobacteroides abscessus]